MPLLATFSASLLSLEKRGGRRGGRGEEVVVSPLGLGSVRCWGRGRAGVLGRRRWTLVPECLSLPGVVGEETEAPYLKEFRSWPCRDIAAPATPDDILLAARLLPDCLNLVPTRCSPSVLLPLSQGQGELRPEIILCQLCLFEI